MLLVVVTAAETDVDTLSGATSVVVTVLAASLVVLLDVPSRVTACESPRVMRLVRCVS